MYTRNRIIIIMLIIVMLIIVVIILYMYRHICNTVAQFYLEGLRSKCTKTWYDSWRADRSNRFAVTLL